MGDSLDFDIFYVEGVRKSWPAKSALLIHKQENFLKNFAKRVDGSCTVGAYDDSMVPPFTTSVAIKN